MISAFGPIGDSAIISLTQSSQRFALGTLAAQSPAIRLLALNASQQAWYIRFGDNSVTVSVTDGMRAVPASQNAPLVLPVPDGATHVAILAEGATGNAQISYGGYLYGEFSPIGASSVVSVTQNAQLVALPTLGSIGPCIRLVSKNPSITSLWVKLGNSGVVGSLTTSMRIQPGSVDSPAYVPVTAGQTHLSIFCEGVGGDVVLTGGDLPSATAGSITNAQLANMAEATVKGRAVGAGTGDPTDLSRSQTRAITGSLFGQGSSGAISSSPTNLVVDDSGKQLTNFNANRTVNLPTTSAAAGVVYSLYTLDGGSGSNLTVNVTGTGTILFPDGSNATSIVMTNGQRMLVYCDGSNWLVITANFRPTPGIHLLTSGTVSSVATLDLVLTSYTAFRALKFVLQLIPATDGVALYSRFSTNGGSSYDSGASDYDYAGFWIGDATGGGTTNGGIQSGAAAQIQLSSPQAGYLIGNGTAEGTHTEVTLIGQTNAALWSRLTYQGYHISNNATPLGCHQTGGGARETAQDTDAIRFLFSSGNIASGNYAVYGMA